jgi:hypothetical protein
MQQQSKAIHLIIYFPHGKEFVILLRFYSKIPYLLQITF